MAFARGVGNNASTPETVGKKRKLDKPEEEFQAKIRKTSTPTPGCSKDMTPTPPHPPPPPSESLVKELEKSEDEVIPPTPQSPVCKLRARRRLNFDKPLPKLKLNLKKGTSEFTSTPPKEKEQEESFELIPSPPVTEIFRSWKDAVRGENQMETDEEGADYHGSDQDDETYIARPLGLADYLEMIETCEDIDERMNCFRKLD